MRVLVFVYLPRSDTCWDFPIYLFRENDHDAGIGGINCGTQARQSTRLLLLRRREQ